MSGRTAAVLRLLAALGLVVAVAAFGAQFRPGPWYAELAKPAWTPPDAVFPVVWTLLYAMMAVAAWLVWQARGLRGAALPLGMFLLQLILNGLWPWLFFGLQRPDLAFCEILPLWAAVLATLVLFWRVRPAAGVLLLPYAAWASFAVVLNGAVWRLNA